MIVLSLLALITILQCIKRSQIKKKLARIRLEELKYPDREIPKSFLSTVSAVTVPKKSLPIEYSVYRVLEEASRNPSRGPSKTPGPTPTPTHSPTSRLNVPTDLASSPSVL